MRFNGQRVVVTGAGKGIGRSTAKVLHAEGARIVAISRAAADLESLKDEIDCETIACDLADAEATRAAALAARPIDLLVNNAGITELESLLDTKVETFDLIMAVNARAALIFAQEAARDMISRGHQGAIVNVSSLASNHGLPDHTSYTASKGALDAMTRVWAVELGRHGIRVNTINPTVTLTPMAVKAWSDEAKAAGMLNRIPLHRFATPEDVANVIAWLLGSDSAMVNGVCLLVDGGFRAF
jgi:NAD(P)-dependent dehydrogenase (short-subunit alcohol dehydrogenase family)